MSEETKEELLARIAELEKQAGAKKSGRMEFRVGEKGGPPLGCDALGGNGMSIGHGDPLVMMASRSSREKTRFSYCSPWKSNSVEPSSR